MMAFSCSTLLLIILSVFCKYQQADDIVLGERCGKGGPKEDFEIVQVINLNESDRIWCVTLHNKLRSEIASGKHKDKSCPRGRDILEMVWDSELEEKALKWVTKCYQGYEPEADRRTERFDYGQNMYTLYTPPGKIRGHQRFIEPKAFLNVATLSWFSQIGAMNRRRFYNHSVEVERFTQLAWHSTKYIGCAIQRYFAKSEFRVMTVVCNYGPRGNIKGKPVYHVGEDCKPLCSDRERQPYGPHIIDDNSGDLNAP